jgi:hypothetical protein
MLGKNMPDIDADAGILIANEVDPFMAVAD